MSEIGSIPATASRLIQVAAEKSQTETQIAYAVAGKQQQAARQAGQAAVDLIAQAAELGTQLSEGRLDVRV